MNGHCYVLLSLYNIFSPWWKYDRLMIQTVHTVTGIWCMSMELFLFMCCFLRSSKICFFQRNPLGVCTILAALDMSHIKWLYFSLFVSLSLALSLHFYKHTLTNPHIFVAHSFGKSAGVYLQIKTEEKNCHVNVSSN